MKVPKIITVEKIKAIILKRKKSKSVSHGINLNIFIFKTLKKNKEIAGFDK